MAVKSNRIRSLIAFLVPLVVAVVFIFHLHPELSSDSIRYSNDSDALIRNHFDLVKTFSGTNAGIPLWFYSIFVILCALGKVIFADHWVFAIVGLNAIFFALTSYMFAKLLSSLRVSSVFIYLFIIYYTVFFDIILWTKYVLSDTIFMFLTCYLFYYCVKTYKSFSGVNYIACAVLSLLMLFFRPTAIFIIAPIFVSLWAFKVMTQSKLIQSRRFWAWSSVIFVVVLFCVVLVHSLIIKDTSYWPLKFAKNYVELLSSDYHNGIVVYSRPESYSIGRSTVWDYFGITVKKFIYFFAVYAKDFSRSHILISIVTYVPLYVFSIVSLFTFRRMSQHIRLIFFSGFFVVFALAFFTAITQLDYDWRYRLPILPILIFLSILSLDQFIRYLRTKHE